MPTIAEFLIERLANHGVKHVFNVPGDYSLAFNKRIEKSPLSLIGTTCEANAGFAADAYARINGLSAICVTYCVGGHSIINPIGGAFAEKSPVIVISGSPGMKERQPDVLLHHMVGSFESQYKTFDEITCARTVLSDPMKAAYEIDRVIEAAKHYKQPVYIELPRDMVDRPITYDAFTVGTPVAPTSDGDNLREVLAETAEWLAEAKNPVIWAGVEIARFGLGQKLMKFAEQTGIPVATDILGKSVVSEKHPLYMGVYSESTSRPEVLEYFNRADCVLMLGVMMTDMNLGFLPLKCKRRNTIKSDSQTMQVRNHTFERVQFDDFMEGLCKIKLSKRTFGPMPQPVYSDRFEAKADTPLSVVRLFEKINSVLNEDMLVVADVGDSLFGSLDITVHGHNKFLASAFYTSMGFAVPGGFGAQLANPKMRPIVIVGDGSFQMTGMEFSSMVRFGQNPIVVVVNNGGYGTERILLEGSFNDIQPWNFENLPLVVGGGKGFKVTTEVELETAFSSALASKEPTIINAVLMKGDYTPALTRMFGKLAKKV
jgi:indolepyruvate decarboxylase